MNLLGYLITLSNIRTYESSGGPIKDLSINIGDIQSLTSELTTLSGFHLEDFKETGFFRIGYVGKYLSKNLREYIYQGKGEPTDEAVILTVHYKERKFEARDDDSFLSFLVHKGQISDEERKEVQTYLDIKNDTQDATS